MASSKDCAVFAKAKRVQEVKEQHKISYAEAVKKVEGKPQAQALLFGYMKEVQEAQGAQNQSSSQSSTGSGAGDGVEEEEINMEEGGLEAFFGGI
uniref:Uncharacterized protein n=1 Tax=Knipowitschia caucasica TaxID=637954 RepID=A0AAV2J6X9_KNICA